MKTRHCSNILIFCASLLLALSARSQEAPLMEDILPEGGSGITQLTENIQSLLEPVGGGIIGGGGTGSGDDFLSTENDPDDGDGVVPIDGGLSLLLAAGASYGARRLRRRRDASRGARTES